MRWISILVFCLSLVELASCQRLLGMYRAFEPELDMDWIHPWIGLDWIGLNWVRSFIRFIVFLKMEAPLSSVFFR